MSLGDDYLEYPHRRRGMDHDRYDWSILFRRPKIEWPNGAKLALWVVPAPTLPSCSSIRNARNLSIAKTSRG